MFIGLDSLKFVAHIIFFI